MFSAMSQSPFSPWQGDKVADMPDEGVIAKSLLPFPGGEGGRQAG